MASESYQFYNDEKKYDYNTINCIREQIENMSKFNQIEVLRILKNHKNIIINENKYGIHINLTELDFSENMITSLEPLKGLTQLESLVCSFNDLSSDLIFMISPARTNISTFWGHSSNLI